LGRFEDNAINGLHSLAFYNELDNREVVLSRLHGDDSSTMWSNLVSFWAVT